MKQTDRNDNNLFSWATKELSQDAVIAWILSMKNKEGKTDNRAKCFLKEIANTTLLNGWEKILPDEFEIEKVYSHDEKAPSSAIDIFVEIKDNEGKHYAVIIEDKTASSLHSQQLLKYVSAVAAKRKRNSHSMRAFILRW